MPQHIQAPDGSLVEFPDGMTDEQITAVMHHEYGGGPRPTSQMLGLAEGASKPIDHAAAWLEGGLKKVGVPTDAINHALGMPSAQEANDTRQAAFHEAEKTHRPGTIGKVTGEVATTLPLAAVTTNPWALGAMQGAALSDSKNATGVAMDAAGGALLNKAGGAVLDKVSDFIKPVIDPAVQALHDAGVKLTPGMIKGGKAMVREDKAMSKPIVGDMIAADRQGAQDTFNTATVNKALEPLGLKVPTPIKPGHDAVAYAHQAVSDAYDRVIPNLAVSLDNKALAAKIAPQATSLPKAQQDQLRSILNNQIGKGNLAGQQLKNAQGEIRRLARTYSTSQDATQRELGRVLGSVDDELSTAMVQQNPQYAPELQKVNRAFRGLALVEDAASRADGGTFNTGQLKQAVRRGDFSARKSASAMGDAYMQDWSDIARDVLPARSPNPSGTAAHMQAGSLFANLGGAAKAGGYTFDNWLQQSRLAARPAAANTAANALKRIKGPVSAAFVAGPNALRD
jgi:hypothetical protein